MNVNDMERARQRAIYQRAVEQLAASLRRVDGAEADDDDDGNTSGEDTTAESAPAPSQDARG